MHEYVLKLVDVEKCPAMDEHCPEADKLDITKCLSGKPVPSMDAVIIGFFLFSGNSRRDSLSD